MRVDPGGGDGFSVDPASLSGVAGQVGRAYDDYNTVIVYFCGADVPSGTELGQDGVPAAWSAFESAWSAELSTTSLALAELTRKLQATSDNYRANEAKVAEGIAGVGGGLR
jgi:hypothetical protein